MESKKKPTVIILSVSSDIGFFLAQKYLKDGWRVIGTFRTYGRLNEIHGQANCHLFHCDILSDAKIRDFVEALKELNVKWDVFICCVGDLTPYQDFFKADFDTWSRALHINAIEPLRAIHSLWPLRNQGFMSTIVFFAGSGVNGPAPRLSAYTAAKIMLIKMGELLDNENPDLNIFIVGPGWRKTKIHQQVREKEYCQTMKNAQAKLPYRDTLEDIYAGIRSLARQSKKAVSGRNFSIIHDPISPNDIEILLEELSKNRNMYKLRRSGNNFQIRK